jgi:hypothetical protein
MYRSAEALRAELPTGSEVVALSQGDILDGCPLVYWDDSTTEVSEQDKPHGLSARVIILTQACDLANAKTTRIVVAVLHDASELVRSGRVKEKFIRDNVRSGRVYGWYFLPSQPDLQAMPESLVDLRDLHTVPRGLLEGLRDRGLHICRLVTPYREHLAQHFSVTYSRIGLPEPYSTLE